MVGTNQPARHPKRSRVSDAPLTDEERVKRRRFSEHNDSGSVQPAEPPETQGKIREAQEVLNHEGQLHDVESKTASIAPWSFSRPVGGRYSDLDPILTSDEG